MADREDDSNEIGDAETSAKEAANAAAAAGARGSGRATKRQARRASPVHAVVPFLAALIATVALQFFIQGSVAPDAYVYRLFRPPGGWIMGIVPGLIVFVLVWTLVDLALKYRTVGLYESDLDRREIKQLPRVIAQEPTGVTQRRILAMDGRDRPVAQRLLWLLYYLESNADAQRTHELLRHQADLDADTAAAGYRTVKLFIWAMPILGFVGTVLGISLAVGGFSEFLTTTLDIDDVSRVTGELGNVASGLSFAFDTTLLGLLAGLVANTVASGVQKMDERFFTRLDELGLGIVANRQSAAPAAGAPAPTSDGAEFERVMKSRLDELTALVNRTQQIMNSLSDASARMSNGLTASIGTMNQSVEQLNGSLQSVSDNVSRTMSGLSERVASSESHLRQGLAGLQETLDTTQRQTAASAQSQASIERAVQQLSTSLNELGETLSELRRDQNALAPVLSQLAGPLELRLTPVGRGPGRAEPRAGGPAGHGD